MSTFSGDIESINREAERLYDLVSETYQGKFSDEKKLMAKARRMKKKISLSVDRLGSLSIGDFEIEEKQKEMVKCQKELAKMKKHEDQKLKELEKSIEKQRILGQLKSKFIDVVSHQLRTPLNGMRWNLEMFIAGDLGKLTEEQHKFLWLTYEVNQNILRTIQDLLLALEIEEKNIVVEKETVSLYALVKALVLDFDSSIQSKGHKVTIDEDMSKFSSMELDATKLGEVIKKLLDNSIKYTSDNGKIMMKATVKNGKLYFEVKDNGIGIPKGAQDKMFKKFFRASNAAEMHPDASGLGLFISKAYVKAMGGAISFKSIEGKGTTFEFDIKV